jgi:ubiquitin-protein ligase
LSGNKYIPDIVLAREANLMYEKGRGFEPIRGDLTRWRGLIPGRGEFSDRFFTVEIELFGGFPATPPLVKMISEVDHPRVSANRVVDLWITKKWSPEYHLFQVANSIKGLFAREPLRPAAHLIKKGAPKGAAFGQSATALAVYRRQKAQLEQVLRQKDEEIAALKEGMKGRSSLNRKDQREKYLHRRRLALGEELFDIEEKFHWADLTAVDFAKEYLRVRTQLQLIAIME